MDWGARAAAYANEASGLVVQALAAAASNAHFRDIYRVSSAADAVIGALGGNGVHPPLGAARRLILRLPLLFAAGQNAAFTAELRRTAELVLWAIYFTDHPVEWWAFQHEQAGGFFRDQRQPIRYAAFRDLAFYAGYAEELMKRDPSGLGREGTKRIRDAVATMNSWIHPGHAAAARGHASILDAPDTGSARSLASLAKQALSGECLLLAAFRWGRFGMLGPAPRAHFDWLVGSHMRKRSRAGPVGIG